MKQEFLLQFAEEGGQEEIMAADARSNTGTDLYTTVDCNSSFSELVKSGGNTTIPQPFEELVHFSSDDFSCVKSVDDYVVSINDGTMESFDEPKVQGDEGLAITTDANGEFMIVDENNVDAKDVDLKNVFDDSVKLNLDCAQSNDEFTISFDGKDMGVFGEVMHSCIDVVYVERLVDKTVSLKDVFVESCDEKVADVKLSNDIVDSRENWGDDFLNINEIVCFSDEHILLKNLNRKCVMLNDALDDTKGFSKKDDLTYLAFQDKKLLSVEDELKTKSADRGSFLINNGVHMSLFPFEPGGKLYPLFDKVEYSAPQNTVGDDPNYLFVISGSMNVIDVGDIEYLGNVSVTLIPLYGKVPTLFATSLGELLNQKSWVSVATRFRRETAFKKYLNRKFLGKGIRGWNTKSWVRVATIFQGETIFGTNVDVQCNASMGFVSTVNVTVWVYDPGTGTSYLAAVIKGDRGNGFMEKGALFRSWSDKDSEEAKMTTISLGS
ncbi:OLC1v1003571C1 [Oldenlandia corymbosa var. corymbosa]|uniref:OLC1v1003571C1 n=1 Tax=Oldenlandia corymbosa var. corymbosa TaxID=529605 RepID=A0AAV1DB45_OLDCO|nr:OLC1v1003571C1 [Oldenlandia corymbosa var. corymbosa]